MIKIFFLFIISFSFICHAEGQARKAQANTGWAVSAGAALLNFPLYQGDDQNAWALFPNINIRYQDFFSASVARGARLKWATENLDYGLFAKYKFSRKEERGSNPFVISGKTDDLKGLGDVDSAVELGSFVKFKFKSMSIELEVKQALGGYAGLTSDLSFAYAGNWGPLIYSFLNWPT